MKLKNEKQLLAIASDLGYNKPKEVDTVEYFKYKAKRLYNSEPKFKKFLDTQTSFLPKSVLASQRWHYYVNGDTKPHLCPACNGFIPDYKDKYCSHVCSTKHKDPKSAKTGPKVDLGKKEKELKARLKSELPEYKLVKFGHPRSTFKHVCGRVIESVNYVLFKSEQNKKCSCLHVKAVTQNLANLKRLYKKRESIWVPVEYVEGASDATFKNHECKHKVTMPWSRNFDMRCSICFTNKFASNIVTPQQYRAHVKELHTEFKVLDDYVDVGTRLRYEHSCGGITETTPEWFKQKSFRCCHCGPRTQASLHTHSIKEREFKVRGKEAVALKWIFENTKIQPKDIEIDSEGRVPNIRYLEISRKRTQSYFPDFHVPHKNLIVEVKDITTIGLRGNFYNKSGEQLWATNCAKAEAVLKAGYKFKMLVFDNNNERIKLPKDWHTYSYRKIIKWFKAR